tara:strand:- start:235 stop:843 length:609 start_codon:yes stop_codon:yes gene_type:complete
MAWGLMLLLSQSYTDKKLSKKNNKKFLFYYIILYLVLMKICTKCSKEKELTEFFINKDKRIKRGFTYKSECKTCHLIRYKETHNKETINRWRKNKLKSNPLWAMKQRLKCRTSQAFQLNSIRKPKATLELLGCDYTTAFTHLEKQFTAGMTWENRSLWHIDHIIPLASATTEEELIKLCHYTNLQPLWAEDNLKKGDKIFLY